jgi:hypothetical protein
MGREGVLGCLVWKEEQIARSERAIVRDEITIIDIRFTTEEDYPAIKR